MSSPNHQTSPEILDADEEIQLVQRPTGDKKTQTLSLIGRTTLGVVGFITLVIGAVLSVTTGTLFILLAFAGIAALLTSGFLFLNNQLNPKQQPVFDLKIQAKKPMAKPTSKSASKPIVSPSNSSAFFEKESNSTNVKKLDSANCTIDPPRLK